MAGQAITYKSVITQVLHCLIHLVELMPQLTTLQMTAVFCISLMEFSSQEPSTSDYEVPDFGYM